MIERKIRNIWPFAWGILTIPALDAAAIAPHETEKIITDWKNIQRKLARTPKRPRLCK